MNAMKPLKEPFKEPRSGVVEVLDYLRKQQTKQDKTKTLEKPKHREINISRAYG